MPGPGAPDSSGLTQMSLYPTKNKTSYRLAVENIQLPATAAHPHRVSAGETGKVVPGLKASVARATS